MYIRDNNMILRTKEPQKKSAKKISFNFHILYRYTKIINILQNGKVINLRTCTRKKNQHKMLYRKNKKKQTLTSCTIIKCVYGGKFFLHKMFLVFFLHIDSKWFER